MNIVYKTKKWDKNIESSRKIRQDIINRYGADIEELNIKNKIDNYTGAREFPVKINDLVSLYHQIGWDYRLMSERFWQADGDFENCAGNFYRYLTAMKKSYDLRKSGVKTTNSAIELSMSKGKDFKLIFSAAIALNEFELFEEYSDYCPIMAALYRGDFDRAKILIDELPDEPDDSREVYYTNDEFLKGIYLALLDKNEKNFNNNLAARIRKYRKNMIGYLTSVDIVSVALIKLACREEIHYNFDVIEIPKGFFDSSFFVDKDKFKLPEIK